GGLFEQAARRADEIAEAYEACDTNRVTRIAMALADRANEYVEARAPWSLRKQEGKQEEVRAVCSVALNLFRQITLYLEPILPRLAAQARALLAVEAEAAWRDAQTPLTGNALADFEHLLQRVDPERVQAVVATSVEAER
ncbi:MAG: class I tRNA ligase family protein, partial [Myxococcales bacterium]|nr:class I tRNA ligase family protein [Myxococcales bacterium]